MTLPPPPPTPARSWRTHAWLVAGLAALTAGVAAEDLAPAAPRLIDLGGLATCAYVVGLAIVAATVLSVWRRERGEPPEPANTTLLALVYGLVATPMLLLWLGYRVMEARQHHVDEENERVRHQLEAEERDARRCVEIDRWWTTSSSGDGYVLTAVVRARSAGTLRLAAGRNGPDSIWAFGSAPEGHGVAYAEYAVASDAPTTLALYVRPLAAEERPGGRFGQEGDDQLVLQCADGTTVAFWRTPIENVRRLPAPTPPTDEPPFRAPPESVTWGPDR